MSLVILMTKKNNVKKNIEKLEMSSEAKNLIIVTVVVLAFLALFYFVTVIILDNGDKKNTGTDEVEVQHKEVLVGTSFSIKDSNYYVFYYETGDDEISSDASSLVSKYRSSNKDIYLYTVDMSNALNQGAKSDSSNSSATNASELKISGPTLIKFTDGAIAQYVEGMDAIEEILNN